MKSSRSEDRESRELVEVHGNRLVFNFHAGQVQAWQSARRFVAVIAGTQSGKTSFGPLWLWREMMRRGPGDYLVVTPTFPLLELKALPEFVRLFDNTLNLGKYTGSPTRRFRLSKEGEIRLFGKAQDIETNVIFGYATDPDSLESATAKAAWLDEAGQKKFKLGSWEAILRRLSLAQGRVLITTTPYDLGWLKQKIWDQHQAGNPDIDVIRFESIANPKFSSAEFERARRDMPRWKFDMFYRAIFTRPAGLIYGSFNEALCKIPRFAIPNEWPRFLGLDFGGVNTAGLFYARELAREGEKDGKPIWGRPTGRLYLYREYKAGERTAAEHSYWLLKGEPMVPFCIGGSRSESQWRAEFRSGGEFELVEANGTRRRVKTQGLPVRQPDIKDVEVGIDRVYGCHARNEIFVFDDLDGYLEEKASYARAVDPDGEPTDEIEDKNAYHFMDAERYIIGYLAGGSGSNVETGASLW